MKTKIMSVGIAIGLTTATPLSAAAVTTLSGGVTTGYEYFDRQYDESTASDNDDYSRIKIAPFVTITSETARQSAEFAYAPSFWYDFDQSENDTNHRLLANYTRYLTKDWNFIFSDNLIITDEFNSYRVATDPETGEIISGNPGANPETGDTLRDARGRRRYTNNVLNLGSSYTYLEDSTVAVDYRWSSLNNSTDFSGDNYQDYDKHNISLTLAHRLNSRWKATAVAGYILGLYEDVGDGGDDTVPADSDDVDEYRGSLLVDYRLSPLHDLSGEYSYNQSDFESDLRQDSEIHNLTFGWGWNISPRLDMRLGGGPTYLKRDGQSDDWNYNANFALGYRLEKGSLGVSASRRYIFDNFSGTDERGIGEVWQVQARLEYAVYQYTSVSAYVGYLNEDRDETAASGPPATETKNTENYSMGGTISYRFHEDYVADLSYGYVRRDSDKTDDNYDDNLIVLTVSYENDFFKW